MKYLCLDIGNVLCYINEKAFLSCIGETIYRYPSDDGCIYDTFDPIWFLKHCQAQLDIGTTTMKDELIDHYTYAAYNILNAWTSMISPCKETIEWAESLIDKYGYKIALLSNIGEEHAVVVEKLLSPNNFFEKTIHHFSFEVGARKPQKLYYQSFLMQYPEFRGCYFIDDRQENLDMAKQFGFRTIQLDLSKDNIEVKLKDISDRLKSFDRINEYS
jgi:FMN phosphatase YigB (HAD superfamily)